MSDDPDIMRELVEAIRLLEAEDPGDPVAVIHPETGELLSFDPFYLAPGAAPIGLADGQPVYRWGWVR